MSRSDPMSGQVGDHLVDRRRAVDGDDQGSLTFEHIGDKHGLSPFGASMGTDSAKADPLTAHIIAPGRRK
jgi:hypothetical protein